MANTDKNSVGIVRTKTSRIVERDNPLRLSCGRELAPIDVAYETYGQINKAGDNAVLICHALSGNAHVAGFNRHDDKKPGWWDVMIGPGKPIDTDKYFVICSNILGGCSGTTGPGSLNPETSKPYGLSFPVITIADMVHAQKILLDKLGIKKLLAVIGGSMGGMQVLQWAIEYPDFVKAVIPVATTTHLSAQSIAFDAVGRSAILGDHNFNNGQYSNEKGPDSGLAIARMIGHITYLSEKGMREKFGRKINDADSYSHDFNSRFSVETYLDYQGQAFVERFDANSYLYITRAMDYFDLIKDYGCLAEAFRNTNSRFLVISFSSDWLFTPQQSEVIVDALVENGKDVSYCNIASPYGHDAFLLEPENLGSFIHSFLEATRNHEIELQINTPTKPDKKRKSSSFELAKRARVDYQLIESLIQPNSSVLDVGCGNGELLARLMVDKNINGMGIELEQELVLQAVKRRICILQHDIERQMKNCADKSFDYIILSQTLQTVKNPKKVFTELLRIGKKVIVSFPNFAHWLSRIQLLLGRAPVTGQLPFEWYDSPNIHFLSLKDFDAFCEDLGVTIEKKIPLIDRRVYPVNFAANLFAKQVIYVTSKSSVNI